MSEQEQDISKDANDSAATTDPPVPEAKLERTRRWSWAWIVPVLAALVGGYLLYETYRQRGPGITITFEQGYGIKPGDAVRHRGIIVGEVETVRLTADMSAIEVGVRLDPAAEGIAVAGSRFWIVRPEVSLEGVEGLDTLVGAQYIGVLPGDGGAERVRRFEGLGAAPANERMTLGGLDVLLLADRRGSLRVGAPVNFRQMVIGRVTSVGLASDATFVEVGVYIEPDYAALVREDSKFWNASGIGLNLDLEGFRLETESLQTIVSGGVTLATPDEHGAAVDHGHRFKLHGKPESDWLDWRPHIPIGGEALPAGVVGPKPLPATLTWQTGRFIKSTKTRRGWVLAVDGGLLGPVDLFRPSGEANEGTVRLEVLKKRTKLPEPAWASNGLALLPVDGLPRGPYPADRMATTDEPENVLLIAYGDGRGIPLDTAHLEKAAAGWIVAASAGLTDRLHGAPVLSRETGKMIGVFLAMDDETQFIAELPERMLQD